MYFQVAFPPLFFQLMSENTFKVAVWASIYEMSVQEDHS